MNSSFKTVEQIAESTNVSVTTVRLVLSGQARRYRISAATVKRIEDYAAEHEIIINHAARSLKLQRSDTIGLVVPNLGNPFFARLMAELESCCQARNLMLLTASSHERPELEALAIRKLLARGVDGVVLAPCQPPAEALFAHYRPRVGVIAVDRAYPGSPFPSVVSNNRESARQLALRLLAEAGGDLLLFSAQTGLPSIRDRVRGFRDALLDAGREDWKARVLDGGDGDGPATGAALVARWLDGGGRLPRALLCSSLVVLEGALQQIKRHLGRVPADLLIGTFDTEAMVEFLPNRVLSAVQDEAAIAQKAFGRLMAQEEEGTRRVTRDVVPCKIITP
jgi:LacI family fructose operon transcriptional repressor